METVEVAETGEAPLEVETIVLEDGCEELLLHAVDNIAAANTKQDMDKILLFFLI